MQQRKQTGASPSEPPAKSSKKTRFQRFEYREIPRSMIHGAPYNPRGMTEAARRRLKDKIEEVGCVTTLVWNERTGNLVSGHRRLESIDALEKRSDYNVAVAVVNLDPKKERELNVFMNASYAQGYFDKDKFFALLQDTSQPVDIEKMGFTKFDIELEFGELPTAESLFQKEEKAAEPVAADIQKMKDARKAYKDKQNAGPEFDDSYYTLLVFNSHEHREAFFRKIQVPPETQFIHVGALEPFLQPEFVKAIDDGTKGSTD